MIDGITIRPFDIEKDLDDALLCFNEGFFHILWPFVEHATPQFNRDLIRLMHKVSGKSYAAEIDGRVCGILLGAAPFKMREILLAIVFLNLIFLPKLIVNAYKFEAITYKHFFQLLYGYSFFLFLHPPALKISEITLFTSRNGYRGQGMGRMLMDAYIESVKNKNISVATVCTDTALSYYFYESYGFEVARKFKMRAYKYSIPGEPFTGLIYRINPKKKAQSDMLIDKYLEEAV